ncbi:hypothetical protein AB6A40_000116 [Gnathostoma spinigerum]|uniref:Uncharacterized protein n=1 Tax=Gnathostoma spinigerum TaxID=75299 RepID=A0ABD6E3I5_9BILA
MNYSFKIEYRNTKLFGQTDGSSGLPVSSDELFDSIIDQQKEAEELMIKRHVTKSQAELTVTAKGIAAHTRKSSSLEKVRLFMLSRRPEECPKEVLRPFFAKPVEVKVAHGCLVWEIRTVILEPPKNEMLAKLHEAPPGRDQRVSLARQFCW